LLLLVVLYEEGESCGCLKQYLKVQEWQAIRANREAADAGAVQVVVVVVVVVVEAARQWVGRRVALLFCCW
jgi:hypothetical protein